MQAGKEHDCCQEYYTSFQPGPLSMEQGTCPKPNMRVNLVTKRCPTPECLQTTSLWALETQKWAAHRWAFSIALGGVGLGKWGVYPSRQ